jgi:tetratricopeptide (TPR) repeat protein
MKGLGNYKEAISHLLIALKKSIALGDKPGMAAAFNNLGIVYMKQSQYQESLNQFLKAIPINNETGNKSWLANNYINVGLIYFELAEKPVFIAQMSDKKTVKKYAGLALQNYSLALEIKEEMGMQNDIADIINNIGLLEVYESRILEKEKDQEGMKEKLNSALNHFRQIIPIRMKSGDKDGLAKAYLNLVIASTGLKNYEQAKIYIDKAFLPLRETGSKELWRDIYLSKSIIDSVERNYQSAFRNFRMYSMYKDSLTNEEDTKKSMQMRLNYEFEVERAADSLKNAQREATERLKHEQALHQQRIYTYGGVAGFVLMMLVAIIALRAYKQKQTANAIISEQKAQVENKQREMLDSIYYAQRIQKSLLPHDKYIERKLGSVTKKSS